MKTEKLNEHHTLLVFKSVADLNTYLRKHFN